MKQTRADVASWHVVERCPRCGVEHDASADSICEACDTPLRAWCRVHGRETGWLDGPACDLCAGEAAPPATRPRASAPALPCPDFSAAAAGAVSPHPAVRGRMGPPDMPEAPRKPLDPVEHLFVMLLMMLMATGGGTLLSVLAGFVYVVSGRGALPDTPLRFALAGAVLGLLSGGVSCAKYLRSLQAPPRTS